jgi:hypothetical protein
MEKERRKDYWIRKLEGVFLVEFYIPFLYHNRGQRGNAEHLKKGFEAHVSVLDDSIKLDG